MFPPRNNIVVFIFLISLSILVIKGLPTNSSNSASKYAKVSHFGSVETGRSSSGQTPWTHRADVRIQRGQNLQSKPSGVVYHYAIPQKSISRKGDDKSDHVPGVGEVEERFNPRPYFQYKEVSPSKQPSTADTTFSSFPVFNNNNNNPVQSDNSRANLYDSPYSSYNPPQKNPIYPPNNLPPPQPMLPTPTTTLDSYAAPPDAPSPDGPYSYKPAKAPMPPPSPTYDSPELDHAPPPPLPDNPQPPSDDDSDSAQFDSPMHGDEGPPQDFVSDTDEENVHFPPGDDNDHHKEVILDHPPPGWKDPEEMGKKAPSAPPPKPQPPMMPDMAEGDLNPPPSDDAASKFPSYLYNGGDTAPHDFAPGPYDFDHHHHVYHEVEHPTTTTEAPEERVNKAHYSYYYLGRKLWYVPLYFSVYFIIYVTILILKSIARHKIQFKHDLVDAKGRNARQMDLENLNDLHRNVSNAVVNFKRRIPFVAM